MKKILQQKKLHYIEGSFEITKSGLGFVINKNNPTKDVLIYPENFKNAFQGDLVLAEYYSDYSGNKKIKGKIIKIIKRNSFNIIGQLTKNKNQFFVIPFANNFLPDFKILDTNIPENNVQKFVRIKFISWEKKQLLPIGEIVEYLPNYNYNELTLLTIVQTAGFDIDFNLNVLEEVKNLKIDLNAPEQTLRTDFRNITTFTIDPIDAKDFDDAISIDFLKNGNYQIGIHIADVSHFVTPNTRLDEEALKRGTSVYLPNKVIPMLPEKISNELCSLRPNEDKLTFSVIVEMDDEGTILNTNFKKTIIHSNHRFTYQDVQKIIDDKKGIFEKELQILNKIAQKVRAKRILNGAINFNSQELKFKLDENTHPIEFDIKISNQAHQLIEEFMLIANKQVANLIHSNKQNTIAFPYRVHDTPDADKLKLFVNFAKKYNIIFDITSNEKIAQSFNNMILKIKGKPEEFILEQLGIRTMAKAIYSTKNIGHYGLGFTDYCHFTSPIRRYPDILAHRILYAFLQNNQTNYKNLDAICIQCSEREKAATNIEREATKFLQVVFMEQFIGLQFEGIISGINASGCWVETIKHKCEGFFNIQSLQKIDQFKFNQETFSLNGINTHLKFTIGDIVTIKIIDTNLIKRQIEFEYILPPDFKPLKK